LVDADTEAVVASYQYTPYGQLLHAEGDADALASNSFGFSTKYHDAELPGADLYYFGYRYYHAGLMTWLNRDPIAEDGGLNLYAFVANQPNTYFDPLGLELAYDKTEGSIHRGRMLENVDYLNTQRAKWVRMAARLAEMVEDDSVTPEQLSAHVESMRAFGSEFSADRSTLSRQHGAFLSSQWYYSGADYRASSQVLALGMLPGYRMSQSEGLEMLAASQAEVAGATSNAEWAGTVYTTANYTEKTLTVVSIAGGGVQVIVKQGVKKGLTKYTAQMAAGAAADHFVINPAVNALAETAGVDPMYAQQGLALFSIVSRGKTIFDIKRGPRAGGVGSANTGQVASPYPQGRRVAGTRQGVRPGDPPTGMREAGAWDMTPDNLARMERGQPPLGYDGMPVQLHHRGQNPAGPLDELSTTTHRMIDHPIQPSQIDRNQFAGERKRYWVQRARELLGQE